MSKFVAFEIPDLYPYVLLMTGATNFLCLIVGFMAGSKRRTIFDREFMKQFDKNLQGEEFTTAGAEVPAGGYPDMGNGLYGKELSYKDWYGFQLDQRAHKNFLEGLTIVSFCALIGGVTNPLLTLIFISLYFIGRILYTIGYRTSAKARIIGAPLIMFVPIAMIITTIVGLSMTINSVNNTPSDADIAYPAAAAVVNSLADAIA